MKLLLLLLLVFVGCYDSTMKEETYEEKRIKSLTSSEVIVIEGCEYFVFRDNSYAMSVWMTHKGNCKNPIHIYSK